MSSGNTTAVAPASSSYYVEIYDFLHGWFTQDVTFYQSLLTPGGDTVLELGCGTGRVLVPLVEAGLDAVGLDISADMLAIADGKLRRCGASERARWELVAADMREYDLGRRFSAVVLPFNTFLYMYTDGDRERCLRSALRHLDADGTLFIDVFNPEWILKCRQPGAQYHEFTKYRPDTGGTFSYFSSYCVDRNLIYWHRFFDEFDRQFVCTRHYDLLKLAYLPHQALEEVCRRCGLEVISAFGWYDRRPVDGNANNLILMLRADGGAS